MALNSRHHSLGRLARDRAIPGTAIPQSCDSLIEEERACGQSKVRQPAHGSSKDRTNAQPRTGPFPLLGPGPQSQRCPLLSSRSPSH